MSNVNQALNTGSQATNNYDLSKIFVYNNRYETETINNSEYDPMTIKAGTVMGRIAGTKNVWPCVASATDGSQHPIGVIAADVSILDGTSLNVPICISGDVVKEKIIMWNTPTDTLDTVLVSRQRIYRDLINDLGIKVVPGTDNTYLDNQ